MKPAYGFIEVAKQKRRTSSMKSKFIIFSSVLFLLTFVFGSTAFVFSMWKIQRAGAAADAAKTVDMERLRFEALVNAEIALVLRMADSPLIQRYFMAPENKVLESAAFEEIEGYRRAFSGNSVFWVNDKDKKFYFNGDYIYTVDSGVPEHNWYEKALRTAERFVADISKDSAVNATMLWLNVPVFGTGNRLPGSQPLGIAGTGIHLSALVDSLYKNYTGRDSLYFFNSDGEVTGAGDTLLITGKVSLETKLGEAGTEILAAARELEGRNIRHFSTSGGVAALGAIPALNWYIAVFHPLNISDTFRTSQTILFLAMMLIIVIILVISNLYVKALLAPLNEVVDSLHKMSSEWDLVMELDTQESDEVGLIGKFINMTITDPLTGIYNRRFLEGTLRRLIKVGSRTSGILSVLMIDIDFFKKYNDTYGHPSGDVCLKTIAGKLASSVSRDEDFVARYGGEEFVVVLPHTDAAGAALIAQRFLDAVRESAIPHEMSETAPVVTVSIGGTTAAVNFSQSPGDYIAKADEALYAAKKSGRDRYMAENF